MKHDTASQPKKFSEIFLHYVAPLNDGASQEAVRKGRHPISLIKNQLKNRATQHNYLLSISLLNQAYALWKPLVR